MKLNKVEDVVWKLFAFIGIIFIIIGIVISLTVFNYDNKINTEATITNITSSFDTDGDKTYKVTVTYNIDGTIYTSSLNGYSSSFYEGKKIKIYYDKDNPYKIGVKSLDLVFLVFPLLGLIFSILGFSGIIIKKNKKKLEITLKETGDIIYAKYVSTVLNTNYSVNGVNPYKIICKWIDPVDNKEYTFKSKNIWTNPETEILNRNIKQFPIYLDRTNKKKYILDLSILNIEND